MVSQKSSFLASLWAQRALPWLMSYWCVKLMADLSAFFPPSPISMQRSTKKKVTKKAERNLSFFDSWSCFSLDYISPFSLVLAAKGNLKHLIRKPVWKTNNQVFWGCHAEPSCYSEMEYLYEGTVKKLGANLSINLEPFRAGTGAEPS